MHNFTQIALDLLFDKLDTSDAVKNQEKRGQQVVNCESYETAAEEFSNDILTLLKSEEVFVEFVYCDFKRQSLEIKYGYDFHIEADIKSKSLIDLIDFK